MSWKAIGACVLLVACGVTASDRASGQEYIAQEHRSGQNIAPAYEGWEENADGSFNLVFGYLNRNYEEHLDIPIGPDNNLSPGPPDQGQPTHFLPRRNRYVFRVKVPKDFDTKEIVWTLTAHGKTEKAYATLKPPYNSNERVMMLNNNAFAAGSHDVDVNKGPAVRVEGPLHRTVRVGQSLALTAIATDDGVPKPAPAKEIFAANNGAKGLRVAWFVYRGVGKVTFDPEPFNVWVDYRPGASTPWTPGWIQPPVPPDGKFFVKATFGDPGVYVLRVQAHDGGLDATQDITVEVKAN